MNNISVGDLVMIVKPISCCLNSSSVGKIFTVTDIVNKPMYCTHCKTQFDQSIHAKYGKLSYSFDRLKKIPPISELEDKEIKEEIPC